MAELSLSTRIRLLGATYLSGRMDFPAYQAAFTAATWDVDLPENDPATDFINDAELRMAEYTSGHRTEDEFKELLRWILQYSSGGTMVATSDMPVDRGTSAVRIDASHYELLGPLWPKGFGRSAGIPGGMPA